MKKFKLAIVALAGLAMTACSNENFAGGEPDNALQGTAIEFGPGFRAVTRAAVGGDAADLLGNQFIVYGGKGDATSLSTVFDNYKVQWAQNTAGRTESNTNDWEYVGFPVPEVSTLYSATDNPNQSIKYWDYSTSLYKFAAYSVGKGVTLTTGTPAAGQVKASTITYDATNGITYTLEGAEADLAKCYISNLNEVAKTNYQKVVQLEFRSLAAKVRVAMYETVSGYAVKNVKFYSVDAGTNADLGQNTTADVTLFNQSTNAFFSNGQYTISFPNATNEAHVALTPSGGAKSRSFGALNYGATNALGESLTAATYNTGGYTTVLPNEAGVDLELRVDYTLESLDGSGETITVHGAKAFVPQIYAKWLPNYAYTYVFKISDNSNGRTSIDPDDPEGLFPITFDAYVVDSEENNQSTITTVATPSITTYQKGHDPEAQDEYEVLAQNPEIYVRLINNGTLINDLNATGKSKLYELGSAANEVDVMSALNIGRNNLTMTEVAGLDNTITSILGPDGNTITVAAGTAAKFTPEAGKTYAYVYLVQEQADTNEYTAVKFDSDTAPADWDTAGLYYADPQGTAAAGAYVKNKVFYMKYTNSNDIYAVKIIKIKP